MVDMQVLPSFEALMEKYPGAAYHFASTKAPRAYTEATFHDGCYLFFGKETKGLPEPFLEAHAAQCLRIPMRAEARSLNLSNSVAITVFEALRQLDYPGLSAAGKMAAE